MNLIFFTVLLVPLLGWDVVLSSLNEWDFTNDRWTESDGTTLINVKSCPSNGMKLLCLDGDIKQAETHITELPPHFELKVLADLYYVASFNYEYGKLKLDSTQVFSKVYGWDVNMTSYFNQCGSWGVINSLCIKTAAYTLSHAASSVWIYLSTNLNEAMPNEGFCFRNVQLFINPCHYSCLTCNGGLINNCQSCYDGSTPVSGKCPICINPNLSFQTSLSGCVQECTRTYYLADKTKFCQFNNRVSAESTSFDWPINVIPSSYDWNLYNNGVFQSQRYFTCLYFNLVGMYVKEEYITKSYTFSSTTRQIRLRVSHYMFNVWNQYSQIQLLMDGVQVSLIYMKNGLFRTINNNIISSSINQCSNLATNEDFYLIRTEQMIKITNLNPTFTFKSSQDLWSVRDIYVDIIVCSLYCSTCLDDQNCSVCQASYYLYKGQCISSCPEYSTLSEVNCIDFDEETQYTNYLIKAFYSIYSQDDETSLFNLISSSGINLKKGDTIYFSYLKDRRIFGGALVWLNAKFGNTYSIPQPHYAVRVRMLVILGDDFGNGKFQYKLNADSVVILTRTSTFTTHSQQWGDTMDEYFYQVNTLVSHTTSSFSITVECINTTRTINEAFCGITNYFVTVLECQTFCDSCTDILTCSSWSTTTANFDPTTHQCYPGYSPDTATKICVANPNPVCGNGIVENNEQCDDKNLIPADGCFNCQYQCSSYYSNCVNLIRNSCDFGYYQNQFDNICYPKCGDGIIVAEEQCEDGNILPFDGCHRCMFSCQENCKECVGWNLIKQIGYCLSNCGDGLVNGKETCDDMNEIRFDGCYECQFQCEQFCTNCQYGVCIECNLGFDVIDNNCFPICGDLLVVGNEDCDDGNLIPYDGCFECKFQCEESCTDCQDGVCYECNTLGFELIDNHCLTICGDSLIRGDEDCDDGNLIPYDGCFECKFQCEESCTDCQDGVCYECNTLGFELIDNHCLTICGDSLIRGDEDCDDGNLIPYDGCFECKFQCEESCTDCQDGVCYECNTLGFELIDNHCLAICGDSLIRGDEDCDDGNLIPQDGCFECKFQCEESCTDCQDGVCYECNTLGFGLIDNHCLTICGDSLIKGDEDCDDGNLIPYDGCFECKFQCEESCTDCQDGVCYECNTLGFELIDNHCLTICGDSLIRGDEDCDDGNLIPYDGCFECKFQCEESCTDCQDGVCYECNTLGFELIDNHCLTICGDSLIRGDEDCDNGNLIPYDGCFECKFQCEESCTDCQDGVCYECNTLGFELIDNHCLAICGDSLIRGDEDCDDGNLIPQDGCFECKFQCEESCTDCQDGVCYECNTLGFELIDNHCLTICGDSLIRGDEDCDDGNLIPYDGCFECKFQCEESCTDCQDGVCYECNTLGFELIDNHCLTICGDSLIRGDEDCDDGNLIPYDGCFECKFQCEESCTDCQDGVCYECNTLGFELIDNHCLTICGDSLIRGDEDCDDGNLIPYDGCFECKFQCEESCTDCQDGVCYECNTLGFELIDNHCLTICGDSLIRGDEDCDDGNLIPYDGCFECKFQCDQPCTDCQDGVCYECNTLGFELIDNHCLAICGDSLIRGDEDCDDGNLIPQDGCFECKFQCEESCTDCQDGVCYECNTLGFELIDNHCLTICGDSLIRGDEDCDDGNLIPYDGCFECKFQCEESCTDCQDGVCYECNTLGFELIDNHCLTICGDSLIRGDEDCDDGNLIPYDGCFECKFQCEESCTDCQDGVCYECNTLGFELIDNHCLTICGDSLIRGDEDCDDGNLIPYDGCFECKFQCDQPCTDCQDGVCYECNTLGFELIDNHCLAICGDSLIRGDEDCDDGNQFHMMDPCTDCQDGVCYECNTLGFELIDNHCLAICGDSLIRGDEDCDDGNLIPHDGCFECHFQCPKQCLNCSESLCIQCDSGWVLIDNQCSSLCGDQIVITQFEECDDGNIIPYDGCYECQYQCQVECTDCQLGICYDCDTIGWELNFKSGKSECHPICGDGLVIATEECDDPDNLGCQNCKLTCHEKCLDCNQGICFKCASGWHNSGSQDIWM